MQAETGHVAVSQGTQSIIRVTRFWAEDGIVSPSEPPEGTSPAHTLILDFWPPELWKKKCLSFEATEWVVICYGSSKRVTKGHDEKTYCQFIGKCWFLSLA